ncbi:hypothetical protein DOY81_012734, partial [Sarcophaga bullata]
GATIKTDEETGKIIIARIMHGGAADRSGLIHVGDEVYEVNGINVEEGTITFKLVPSDGKGAQRESKDDAYWWQARKESERTARAGLIPSRALQERRILHERTQRDASDGESKSKNTIVLQIVVN